MAVINQMGKSEDCIGGGSMNNAKKDIKVTLTLTDGWEERVAKAAYNLYLRLEALQNNKQEGGLAESRGGGALEKTG